MSGRFGQFMPQEEITRHRMQGELAAPKRDRNSTLVCSPTRACHNRKSEYLLAGFLLGVPFPNLKLVPKSCSASPFKYSVHVKSRCAINYYWLPECIFTVQNFWRKLWSTFLDSFLPPPQDWWPVLKALTWKPSSRVKMAFWWQPITNLGSWFTSDCPDKPASFPLTQTHSKFFLTTTPCTHIIF